MHCFRSLKNSHIYFQLHGTNTFSSFRCINYQKGKCKRNLLGGQSPDSIFRATSAGQEGETKNEAEVAQGHPPIQSLGSACFNWRG